MADATKKPARKAPAVSPWLNAGADRESLTPNQLAAHEIVVDRRDLTPSVERIMNNEMSEDARGRALAAFATAIVTPGDPNRDPRVAIANAT